MEKGSRTGTRRKAMKRRKSKGFAWALAEYLLSDSYMYAPLVASPPFPSPASNGEPDASPVRRDYLAPSLLTGSVSFGAELVCRLKNTKIAPQYSTALLCEPSDQLLCGQNFEAGKKVHMAQLQRLVKK